MILAVLLFVAQAAWAQDEACEARYGNDDLLGDLIAIDEHFRAVEVDAARQRISGVHRNLVCLDEAADVHGLAWFSRQLALAFFFDQDDDALRRWSRLTRTVAPELPWPADLTSEHPFRETVEASKVPSVAGPEASLALPKKSTLLWNGRLLTKAEAPIETPGLVQLFDAKGAPLRSWWQDGSAFPEDLLGPPGSDPRPPKGYTEAEPDPRFAANAALPLFGEAAVSAPAASRPVVDVDETELAVAQAEEVVGTYVDPFELARRRAIRREYFERSTMNEAGETITKKIEVVTLSHDDRSGGRPVTYEIFEYWLHDHPSWRPAAAVQAGLADGAYLSDWVGGRPPPNAARIPLTWVPHAAAAAYCASFGKTLPGEEATFDDALPWEWRAGGDTPTRYNAKGKVKREDAPLQSHADVGFRCAGP